MVLSRRSFIQDVGIGLSAMIFTPTTFAISWKRTKVVPPWQPHWAILREQWIRTRFIQFMKMPVREALATLNGKEVFLTNSDPVFLREQWYEDMYPIAKTSAGIIVEPFEHMPNDWRPNAVSYS